MRNQNKNWKGNLGITLIALVVTIVVLIILATISINTVLGENGIIKKAQQAKDLQERKTVEEQEKLNTLDQYIGNYLPKTAGTVLETKPDKWTSTQVTAISDGFGGTVPLPDGFYYVGGDYDTGLVISDKEGDTMDASGTSMGNQFVWIPVASEADLTRTDFDEATGQPKAGLSTIYSEPCASGYSDGNGTEEASEYNAMRTKVLQYGGFYIGRFEAGINSDTLRTKVTTNKTVVVKKGVAPYNYVPFGKSKRDIATPFAPSRENIEGVSTNGAVYLATNFDTQEGYTSVSSTLCYGLQWDAMCRYIGDSNRTTPPKSAVELTGKVSEDVSKNIYDLAGNCYEWTMEAYGDYKVVRGGCHFAESAVSGRFEYGPSVSYDDHGFRCTLYIK